MSSTLTYSVPQESKKLFIEGILKNPLIQSLLPTELIDSAQLIHFEGNQLPSIPINWRWAESIAALKAFEAAMLNYLLTRKYNIPPVEVTINTYVYFSCSEYFHVRRQEMG
ncbi:MAG: hypothetical protein Q9195_006605 [Heterodermia aff. obscurata]